MSASTSTIVQMGLVAVLELRAPSDSPREKCSDPIASDSNKDKEGSAPTRKRLRPIDCIDLLVSVL